MSRHETTPRIDRFPSRRWDVLALFILLVLGGGIAVGFLTPPGDWYAALNKPAFNPPNWVFAPVWSLLYILIGIAGWRVWRIRDNRATALWWVQLALNFMWSPVFFALHSAAMALVVILALLATIAVFIVRTWTTERIASFLFLPYLAWVCFATALNAAIVILN